MVNTKPFEPFTEYPWFLNDCLPTPVAVQKMAEMSTLPRVVRVKTVPETPQKDDPEWKERELDVCLVDKDVDEKLFEKSSQGNYEVRCVIVFLNGRTGRGGGGQSCIANSWLGNIYSTWSCCFSANGLMWY